MFGIELCFVWVLRVGVILVVLRMVCGRVCVVRFVLV